MRPMRKAFHSLGIQIEIDTRLFVGDTAHAAKYRIAWLEDWKTSVRLAEYLQRNHLRC